MRRKLQQNESNLLDNSLTTCSGPLKLTRMSVYFREKGYATRTRDQTKALPRDRQN